eukprot:Nk52_evm13s156 gene=Nk52_evmTU13s156
MVLKRMVWDFLEVGTFNRLPLKRPLVFASPTPRWSLCIHRGNGFCLHRLSLGATSMKGIHSGTGTGSNAGKWLSGIKARLGSGSSFALPMVGFALSSPIRKEFIWTHRLGKLDLFSRTECEAKSISKSGQIQEKENCYTLPECFKEGSKGSVLSKAERIGYVLFRLIQLFLLFSPCAVLYYPSLISEDCEEMWWKLFVYMIELAGPGAIKFGQWASSRRDLFSVKFCEHLRKLHDHSLHHSFSETKKAIQESYGEPLESVFVSFDPVPIGSGCVAQVYKAALRLSDCEMDEPLQVAVKVLHPNVQAQIVIDIYVMSRFVKLLEMIPRMKWLSMVESVYQFSNLMLMQLDMNVEAKNLMRFQENFEGNDSVVFPTPLLSYTTENVLVETYEEGTPLNDLIENPHLINAKVSTIGIKAFLKMMILDNFLHGDLHPGNLLVKGYCKEDPLESDIKLCFLDAGIVTELSERDQQNFIDLFTAVVKGQGKRVGELMINRARRQECEDPEAFSKKVENLVNRVRNQTLQLGKISVGDVMATILSLVCEHKVQIESNYASLVISIMVVEGIGRSLMPDLDILAMSLPVLAAKARQGSNNEALKNSHWIFRYKPVLVIAEFVLRWGYSDSQSEGDMEIFYSMD